MNVAVICEYNPFHQGHAYQIEEIRRHCGRDVTVISIMGGVFSQRGEPYFLTPYARAEAALRCGSDLVVELPFPYSCARARSFARAGVDIAVRLGADALAFGSECGDLAALENIKDALDSPAVADEVKRRSADRTMSKSKLYCAALQKVCGLTLDDAAPNDILAVEYLRAIDAAEKKLTPLVFRRVGDYKKESGGFASATHLRTRYAAGGLPALAGSLPPASFAVCTREAGAGRIAPDMERIAPAILLSLQSRTVFPNDGGLTAHLAKTAVGKKRLSDLFAAAKTKRYTDAELRRAALFAFFDLAPAAAEVPPAYTKLLAANARGRALLRTAQIEVLTKPGDAEKLSRTALLQYRAATAAERAFALCFEGDYDFTRQSPYIEKEAP